MADRKDTGDKIDAFGSENIITTVPNISHGPAGYELQTLGNTLPPSEELAKPRSGIRLFAVLIGLNVCFG